MNHAKKKKCNWRRSMSVMLSAALMFSALPVSGVEASEVAQPSVPMAQTEGEPDATPESSAYGVKYEVKQREDGSKYVSVTKLAEDFMEYVDEEGAYAFPEKIDGILVEELKCGYTELPDQVAKITVPSGVSSWRGTMFLGNGLREVHILYLGDLTKEAGLDNAGASGGIASSGGYTEGDAIIGSRKGMDVYLYTSALEHWNWIIAPRGWWEITDAEDLAEDYAYTVHVRNEQVAGRFASGNDRLGQYSSNKCKAVVDVNVSPFQDLGYWVSKAKMLKEENYTKASWQAFKLSLAAAEAVTEDAGDESVNAAKSTLTAAMNALVSLVDLRVALAQAEAQDRELYTKSSLDVLDKAVAAAGQIADDISAEDLAAVTKAVTDAVSALEPLKISTLTITCADVQAPEKPDPQVTQNTSGGEVTFEYSSDDAFRYSDTTPPRDAQTYYVRAHSARTDEYAAAVSEPVQFTIAAAPAQGEGYSLDEESGVLTITDPRLIENCAELGDAPWYTLRAKIESIKVQPAEGISLAKIGPYAFANMKSKTIELPDGIEEIGENAFNSADVETMELPASIQKIGEKAFYNCDEWASTVTLEGITAGMGAFQNCSNLEGTVTLADDTKEIPESLFDGCSKLNSGAEDYPLPIQAESIGAYSFRGTAIRTLCMPTKLKEIGEGAFRNSGLTAIVIPESVELIGKRFVTGSAKLEYVEFENTDYTEENIMLTKETWHVAFEGDYNTEGTFEGLPHTAAILCDGTTYELWAPCAGYYEITYFGSPRAVGWPASILRRTGEYISGYAEEIRASLEASEKLNQSDYSAEAWEALQQAQAEAAELIDKGETNYEKRKNSTAARDRLAIGIRVCLESLQESTKAMAESSEAAEDYDQEADSWYDLGDAMEDAERLLDGENPGPEELLEAIAILKKAVGNLDYTPLGAAKVALDTAITGATDKNESDYTPESWKAYQEAISEAQEARKTGNLEQMEAAVQKVSQAEQALEKKVVPTAEPSSEPSTSTSPSSQPTSNPGASQTPQPSQAPGVNPTAKPGGQGGAQITTPAPKIKKATIQKAKSSKKKTLQVQWKKISGVTGYQVQIATNKKFTKSKKTYTVKKAATNKKTIKKLKRKKTYYIRVRAYRTIKGKKYYGSWSKVKKAKIK